MDGIRVDKRHLEAEQTRARVVVDQVRAGIRKLDQRRVEIADLVSHMVHSGPPLREEATDGRVLSERLEQLDAASADADGSGTHSLVVNRCAVFDLRAEQLLVRRKRRVEILDRNA